jgi:hypothetical protein
MTETTIYRRRVSRGTGVCSLGSFPGLPVPVLRSRFERQWLTAVEIECLARTEGEQVRVNHRQDLTDLPREIIGDRIAPVDDGHHAAPEHVELPAPVDQHS